MKVEIKLFAAARQLAGREAVTVELSAPPTVGQLRRVLAAAAPELAALLPTASFAVDAQYASDDCLVSESSEVACIPPVSGG